MGTGDIIEMLRVTTRNENMKDILSGYELYHKKYGHLSAMAFPLDEEAPWHPGLDSLEYVASQLLAAGYGTKISIVSQAALVKEAINLAEMMLNEIQSRRRERMEACDREVEEEKARREAIGAESRAFISGFQWEKWIERDVWVEQSVENESPWAERFVPKSWTPEKEDNYWLEGVVTGELEKLGFEKDNTDKEVNRFCGLKVKFKNNTYCSFFRSKKEQCEGSLREEYNLHAIVNLPDGLPGVQVWTYKEPTECPIRQTQAFLRHFFDLGLAIEMPQGYEELPF